MEMEFLGDSRCVKAAGFDQGDLTVQFQDGRIYTYEGVSPLVWFNFLRSTSKGYFFNMNIRNNYSVYEGTSMNASTSNSKIMNDMIEEGLIIE
jgi:hypothetical protein